VLFVPPLTYRIVAASSEVYVDAKVRPETHGGITGLGGGESFEPATRVRFSIEREVDWGQNIVLVRSHLCPLSANCRAKGVVVHETLNSSKIVVSGRGAPLAGGLERQRWRPAGLGWWRAVGGELRVSCYIKRLLPAPSSRRFSIPLCAERTSALPTRKKIRLRWRCHIMS
jgi:hypothetical protein